MYRMVTSLDDVQLEPSQDRQAASTLPAGDVPIQFRLKVAGSCNPVYSRPTISSRWHIVYTEDNSYMMHDAWPDVFV